MASIILLKLFGIFPHRANVPAPESWRFQPPSRRDNHSLLEMDISAQKSDANVSCGRWRKEAPATDIQTQAGGIYKQGCLEYSTYKKLKHSSVLHR